MNNSMICRRTYACLAALIVTTTSSLAAQQDQVNRRLTDADVARLIPLLKANVLELTRGQKALATAQDVLREVMDEAGGIADPLSYMRAHGEVVLVPPTARYDVSCSRSRSRGLSPVAIFTFGVSGDKTHAAVLEYLRSAAKENFARYEDAGKTEGIDAIVKSVLSFYKSRGVDVDKGGFGAFGRTWSLGQVWSRHQFSELNPEKFDAILAASPGCEAMATGPTMYVRYDLGRAVGAAEKGVYGESPLASALTKAGMSREEYDAHWTNLQEAQRNANHPEELTSLDEIISRSEDAAEKASWRAHSANARANVEVFRRHAAELEPLVNAILHILFPPD